LRAPQPAWAPARYGWARAGHRAWRRTATEGAMNWDQIAGNWKQLSGNVREQWGKLTDDDLARVEGKRDQLVGRVQERYGIAKEAAEAQVKAWETRI
jgi:uncharacterized protein YjbJ (UPF0337 family)